MLTTWFARKKTRAIAVRPDLLRRFGGRHLLALGIVAQLALLAALFGASFVPQEGATEATLFKGVLAGMALFLAAGVAIRYARDSYDDRYLRWQEFGCRPGDLVQIRAAARWWRLTRFVSLFLAFEVGIWVALGSFAYFQRGPYMLPYFGTLVRIFAGLSASASVAHFAMRAAESISKWPVLERGHELFAGPQDSGPMETLWLGEASHPSLEHLDRLRVVAEEDLPLDLQLARLGVRPEEDRPVPPSAWVRRPGTSQSDAATFERSDEIVESNEIVFQQLRVLVNMGLLIYRHGRFHVTATGREQLALPAVLFITRLPATTRASLAYAEHKFQLGDYEGCGSVCGRALEDFLKSLLRQLLPPGPARDPVLACFRAGFRLETANLGDLVYVTTTVLGVNTKMTDTEAEKKDARLIELGLDTSVRERVNEADRNCRFGCRTGRA